MYFSLGWPKTLSGASVDVGPILLLRRHPLKHLVFALTSEALLVWHARVRLSLFVYACVCVSACVPICSCLKCSLCTCSSTCWWDALGWLAWEKEGRLQILLFEMTEVEWQSAWVCASCYMGGFKHILLRVPVQARAQMHACIRTRTCMWMYSADRAAVQEQPWGRVCVNSSAILISMQLNKGLWWYIWTPLKRFPSPNIYCDRLYMGRCATHTYMLHIWSADATVDSVECLW